MERRAKDMEIDVFFFFPPIVSSLSSVRQELIGVKGGGGYFLFKSGVVGVGVEGGVGGGV